MIALTTVIQKCLDDSNSCFDKMLTTVIQKGVCDRNTHFDKMITEINDHQDGKAYMLNDFERTTKMEYDDADQDRKDEASAFITELSSIEQDNLDACSVTTKISGETGEG